MALGVGVASLLCLEGRRESGLAPRKAEGPKSSLDLHPRSSLISEKLNLTLFVLHSADASTEETIGILFEGEFVPRPPPPSPLTSGRVPRLQSLLPTPTNPKPQACKQVTWGQQEDVAGQRMDPCVVL